MIQGTDKYMVEESNQTVFQEIDPIMIEETSQTMINETNATVLEETNQNKIKKTDQTVVEENNQTIDRTSKHEIIQNENNNIPSQIIMLEAVLIDSEGNKNDDIITTKEINNDVKFKNITDSEGNINDDIITTKEINNNLEFKNITDSEGNMKNDITTTGELNNDVKFNSINNCENPNIEIDKNEDNNKKNIIEKNNQCHSDHIKDNEINSNRKIKSYDCRSQELELDKNVLDLRGTKNDNPDNVIKNEILIIHNDFEVCNNTINELDISNQVEDFNSNNNTQDIDILLSDVTNEKVINYQNNVPTSSYKANNPTLFEHNNIESMMVDELISFSTSSIEPNNKNIEILQKSQLINKKNIKLELDSVDKLLAGIKKKRRSNRCNRYVSNLDIKLVALKSKLSRNECKNNDVTSVISNHDLEPDLIMNNLYRSEIDIKSLDTISKKNFISPEDISEIQRKQERITNIDNSDESKKNIIIQNCVSKEFTNEKNTIDNLTVRKIDNLINNKSYLDLDAFNKSIKLNALSSNSSNCFDQLYWEITSLSSNKSLMINNDTNGNQRNFDSDTISNSNKEIRNKLNKLKGNQNDKLNEIKYQHIDLNKETIITPMTNTNNYRNNLTMNNINKIDDYYLNKNEYNNNNKDDPISNEIVKHNNNIIDDHNINKIDDHKSIPTNQYYSNSTHDNNIATNDIYYDNRMDSSNILSSLINKNERRKLFDTVSNSQTSSSDEISKIKDYYLKDTIQPNLKDNFKNLQPKIIDSYIQDYSASMSTYSVFILELYSIKNLTEKYHSSILIKMIDFRRV